MRRSITVIRIEMQCKSVGSITFVWKVAMPLSLYKRAIRSSSTVQRLLNRIDKWQSQIGCAGAQSEQRVSNQIKTRISTKPCQWQLSKMPMTWNSCACEQLRLLLQSALCTHLRSMSHLNRHNARCGSQCRWMQSRSNRHPAMTNLEYLRSGASAMESCNGGANLP